MAAIPLEKLKVGQSYQADILDEQGAVLIPASTKISDELIQWIASRNVKTVYSNDPRLSVRGDIAEADILISDSKKLEKIDFLEDPINTGFYTFTLNTSDAQSTGLKVISVTASYENYSTQANFLVYLNILERKTTINDHSEAVYYIRPENVWIEDSWVEEFTYKDATTGKILGELSTATYIWEELYDNGTKIEGAFGSGVLTCLDNLLITAFCPLTCSLSCFISCFNFAEISGFSLTSFFTGIFGFFMTTGFSGILYWTLSSSARTMPSFAYSSRCFLICADGTPIASAISVKVGE